MGWYTSHQSAVALFVGPYSELLPMATTPCQDIMPEVSDIQLGIVPHFRHTLIIMVDLPLLEPTFNLTIDSILILR